MKYCKLLKSKQGLDRACSLAAARKVIRPFGDDSVRFLPAIRSSETFDTPSLPGDAGFLGRSDANGPWLI
jgi:hypothetical protein